MLGSEGPKERTHALTHVHTMAKVTACTFPPQCFRQAKHFRGPAATPDMQGTWSSYESSSFWLKNRNFNPYEGCALDHSHLDSRKSGSWNNRRKSQEAPQSLPTQQAKGHFCPHPCYKMKKAECFIKAGVTPHMMESTSEQFQLTV